MAKTARAFISYARRDGEAFANKLRQRLEREQPEITVWHDRAQMEGGIGYGLSAALYGAITLKDGAVQQSNFHDYPVLRIHEMPAVEVHIVPSTEKPTGVGEPGVPPIAPAVANALAAATGKRLRKLPLSLV